MTPLTLACAGVLLVALSLYGVLGGADFGGGVWDALASGPRRGAQRAAVTHALGPVWETNHVWLIFVIVVLFTCFPAAFAAISIGLYVPLTFALAGIVLRGAAFAFRSHVYGAVRTSALWGTVFGIASLLSPFAFGSAVGALTARGYAWHSPLALVIGLFAVALCAQVAAVYLTLETDGALRDDFRARAIAATIVLAAMGALALGVARATAPAAYASLTGLRALAGIAPAMGLGVLTLALVAGRRGRLARVTVSLEVVAVLGGWFASQGDAIVPGALRLVDAAAPKPTLAAFLWLTAAGSVLLVPSLVLLFRVFKTSPRRRASPKA